MKSEKIIILPKLHDQGGDLSMEWFIYFSCRDPRDGKMKRKRVYKGLNKEKSKIGRNRAANKLIKEYSDKLKIGYNPWVNEGVVFTDSLEYSYAAKIFGRVKSSNKNFAYYSSMFIKQELRGLDDDTVVTYTSRLRTFNLFLAKHNFAHVDITAIDNKIIIKFFNYLIDDRKLSGGVSNKYKQILSRLFQFVINEGKILMSPVMRIPENTRVIDKTPRPIKDCDLEQLKGEIMKDDQLWLAVQFEYYCYLRPGKEVRLMKIKWIDFSNGTIMIPKTIMKTKRDKVVTIPDVFLHKLIEEYKLNKFKREFFVFGQAGEPGPGHIGKNNLRNKFTSARDRIGMPKEYKLYSFKHTGNIAAKKAGIPLIERMWNNGHTSERTTEIYDKNLTGAECPQIKERFPEI